MARTLAIDYGKRRCGLAVTDPLGIIANGLDTVEETELKSYLKEYFSKEEVCTIVLGMPKRMDGSYSEPARSIFDLIKYLEKKYPDKTIETTDERYTSKMAVQTMIAGGVPKMKRRNKALIDKVSAVLILQSYLEQKEANK